MVEIRSEVPVIYDQIRKIPDNAKFQAGKVTDRNGSGLHRTAATDGATHPTPT